MMGTSCATACVSATWSEMRTSFRNQTIAGGVSACGIDKHLHDILEFVDRNPRSICDVRPRGHDYHNALRRNYVAERPTFRYHRVGAKRRPYPPEIAVRPAAGVHLLACGAFDPVGRNDLLIAPS